MREEKHPQPDLSALRIYLNCLFVFSIKNIWPDAKFGFCQAVEQGFSCDVDVGDARISEKDFPRIEAEVRQIIDNQDINFHSKPRDDALAWARNNGQDYLTEVLETSSGPADVCFAERAGLAVPVIREEDFNRPAEPLRKFVDLHFKITGVGGAYWLNQADRPQLQRLQVAVFSTAGDLSSYLEELEAKSESDHRRIGRERDLFAFSDLVGSGLPLLPENGAVIRRQLENLVIEEENKRGYTQVKTPDLAQLSLYEATGHYPYYKSSMYSPLDIDGRQFMLRPMTCPHHFEIYKRRPHSFRELPVRLAELANLYRYEQSGELSGLLRVRAFTLSDAHIICRPDQTAGEIKTVLQFIEDVASILGLRKYEDYSYRLSLGRRDDEEKYFKDDQAWDRAEDELRTALRDRGDQFVEAEDEAAFYGPKIDIQMRNRSGREETAFTVQYDFVMPKRLGLTFINSENSESEAVVIHHSIIGSIERCMAFIIEFYGGKFPVWLSPCQLKILTVGTDESLLDYAHGLHRQATDRQIRARLDDSQESVGKKIRQSQLEAAPYVLVVGEKEMAQGRFEVRVRPDLKQPGLKEGQAYAFDEIMTTIQTEAADRS
ncbi:threonine--tRNA ligase [Candidatus Saccharibacteria bacterium]|nr:threonine--tRNA ligase [Candidatus Saccharibacteria bacterium]